MINVQPEKVIANCECINAEKISEYQRDLRDIFANFRLFFHMKRGCSFLFEIEHTNGAITIAAHPRLKLFIVFKDIHTHRVALAGQRSDFSKVVVVDLVHIYIIATITSDEDELVIF